jgi:hypothetical protein
LAALTATAFFGGPAQAADNDLRGSTANPFDPNGLVIGSAAATHVYRFTVPVPNGGKLRALKAGDPSGGVLVLDRAGQAIGAYDLAWAQDTESRPVSTRYRIQGNTLIQEIDFDSSTKFPVTFDIGYNKIDSSGSVSALLVSVPSNYVYNPSLSPTSWHDYCTNSPDEFPNPAGANASFHGPCSRHDMCIQYRWASHQTCNNWLFNDMVTNCQDTYSWYNPVRTACMNTAGVYWAAVTAATVW